MASSSTYFEELGAAVQARGAVEALRSMPPDERVAPLALLREIAAGHAPRYERDGIRVEARFAVEEPAATVPGAGAYCVVAGACLHARVRFDEHERIGDDLRIGARSVDTVELVGPGEPRALDGISDSILHLASPTFTVVVEATGDRSPALELYPPSIMIARDVPARLDEPLRLVDLLFKTQHPARLQLMRELLGRSDLADSFRLLARVQDSIYDSDRDLPAYLEMARARHGARVDGFAAVLSERRRRVNLVARRAEVRDPDHRFLLALLLEVPARDQILSLVAAYAPDRDPIATVVAWVTALAATPRPAAVDANVLGVELGDAERDLFEHALRGRSLDQILDHLRAEYDDVEELREVVEQFCDALPRSALFGPLFTRR
jgi:hypothetical protein